METPDLTLIDCDACHQQIPFSQYENHQNQHLIAQQQLQTQQQPNLHQNIQQHINEDLAHNEELLDEPTNQQIVLDLTIEIDPKSDRNESENFEAYGLSWSILLVHKILKNYYQQVEQQGIFLALKSIDELGEGFSQNFKFQIFIHQQKSEPVEIKINHTFNKQASDQGSWMILKPQCLKEGNGFVKDGKLYVTIVLECVYHMPIDADAIIDEDGRSSPAPSNIPATVGGQKKPIISEALQRLFYDLQTSQDSVSTKELTRSFGWNSDDTFEKHDVQEINRLLLDNLIQKLEHTSFRGCFNHLLE
ncbi:MAG: hypothetical protein EZS28_005484, partial [Streblomastix strix]